MEQIKLLAVAEVGGECMPATWGLGEGGMVAAFMRVGRLLQVESCPSKNVFLKS